MAFTLKSSYTPTGDQPEAIQSLVSGLNSGAHDQTLLGVTGSGKTFTMANVIAQTGLPTLLISHNKTLAAQLYQEMHDFFPDNAVSYFVSYYDYYQPEAYIPSSGTYIEKTADINEKIDKLRLQATTNIMSRRDVIVVASVSCIYNIGNPEEYGKFELPIFKNQTITWQDLAKKLVSMQYQRSEFEFSRGTFRVRGNSLDIYPAYQDVAYRITFGFNTITDISAFDPVSGLPNSEKIGSEGIVIFPAKHYLLEKSRFAEVEGEMRADLQKEYENFKAQGKLVEAQRLLERTNYDFESIKELGYVNGIENYSRYFDGRKPGERPFALMDFFHHAYGDNWLTIVDESHMTLPQIRGMYHGDQARKKTLIDFGFRLSAAIDNRPLKFSEFYGLTSHNIYVSATPNDWELEKSKAAALITPGVITRKNQTRGVVEQLVRPTGIVDPEIEIRRVTPDARSHSPGEIEDVIHEIKIRAQKNERTLVTTLTKKTAEDLTTYLTEQGVRANYLHSDIKTLERTDILERLRKNDFDALIGVNLLREGLDLPEVTLVAILDADKEGFLRSNVSLVQTMGRAARNINGKVIMYADTITGSMASAMHEIQRRRDYQLAYNKSHHITPTTIIKSIREKIIELDNTDNAWQKLGEYQAPKLMKVDTKSLTPRDKERLIKRLEKEMKTAASSLQFETAIELRDHIRTLQGDSL